MKKLIDFVARMIIYSIVFMLFVIIYFGAYEISLILVVGLLYLIAVCFGLSFNIYAAIGAWIMLCVIRLFVKYINKK